VGVFRTESPDTHWRELVKRDYVCVCVCVRARVALIVFLNSTFGAGDFLGVHGNLSAFPRSHIFFFIYTRESILLCNVFDTSGRKVYMQRSVYSETLGHTALICEKYTLRSSIYFEFFT
jgi:hypothetical protein